MEWLNIKLSTLRSPEYLGSPPTARATWLNVLAYCVDQENGGRIAGGAAWKDRQWQQTCGVTAREVRSAGKLLCVEGGDVVAFAFPVEKQEEVQAKRKQAAEAARARWDATRNASRIADGGGEGIASRNAEGEKKGKEKGIPPQSPQPGGAAATIVSIHRTEPAAAGAEEDFRPRVAIPASLAGSADFCAKFWKVWVPYLMQRNAGRVPPVMTLESHLAICVRLGRVRAIAALQSAMEKQWAAPDELAKVVALPGAGRPWDEAPDDWKAFWRETYPPEDCPKAPRYEDMEWKDVPTDHRKLIWEGLQNLKRRTA